MMGKWCQMLISFRENEIFKNCRHIHTNSEQNCCKVMILIINVAYNYLHVWCSLQRRLFVGCEHISTMLLLFMSVLKLAFESALLIVRYCYMSS